MIKMMSKAVAIAVGVTLATHASADFKPLDGDPKTVNFGIISTESTSNLKEQWLPLLSDMEKAIGVPVKPFFAPDYAGIIEGMRFGKVHIAWFGNKSGMEAVDRSGAEVFAQQVGADGKQGYYSYVITHKDSGLKDLKDLLKCDKTLDFGIGDPNSTSGFLVPSYYVFAQNGVDPKTCFKTVRNSNHETNFMATANKQVDAAATSGGEITTRGCRSEEVKALDYTAQSQPRYPSVAPSIRTKAFSGVRTSSRVLEKPIDA